MKICSIILVSGLVSSVHATTFSVGSNHNHITPNELYQANVLDHGDTILIEGGTYTGQAALAHWNKNNLVIRGINGRPHLRANGQYILGKGIWVFGGNDITVENIEFSESSVPDKNGAGIRLDGEGMTARYCYFHHNENGILTSNPGEGDILIEFCEFAYNGFGDGLSHNLYIGRVNRLTFQYNYSHHADIGHNLKSRAKENYIYYNRIMDEETGNSSRLVDISNGGITMLLGNLLMQGNNAPNNNLVGYGLEGLSSGYTHAFYAAHNTMVNKRQASCRFLHIQNGSPIVEVKNNIFAGTGTLIDGATTVMSHNYVQSDIGLVAFQDELNYDYHLRSTSPAIDQGTALGTVQGIPLTPHHSYEHPVSASSRTITGNAPDAGAYEYGLVTSNGHLVAAGQNISIYPNPFTDKVIVNGDLVDFDVFIYNAQGIEVERFISSQCPLYLNLDNYISGVYYISIRHQIHSQAHTYTILKQ